MKLDSVLIPHLISKWMKTRHVSRRHTPGHEDQTFAIIWAELVFEIKHGICSENRTSISKDMSRACPGQVWLSWELKFQQASFSQVPSFLQLQPRFERNKINLTNQFQFVESISIDQIDVDLITTTWHSRTESNLGDHWPETKQAESDWKQKNKKTESFLKLQNFTPGPGLS